MISHTTKDVCPEGVTQFVRRMSERGIPGVARTRAEITKFFDGLDLVEPGVVLISQWRPQKAADSTGPATLWGGVGHKP